ncbi:MAG: diaminopimelate epimerase [Lachnospiraceae bacterium]
MKFTKMQGLGNDYVYVDCTREELATPADVARAVSDRHFGIGSDGLILIKPSKAADFYMEMYNADGSRSAMCGNGIRCVGKYVYDFGLTDKLDVSIETAAGIKYLSLRLLDGKVSEVRVNMGAPELSPEKIPTTLEGTEEVIVNGAEDKVRAVLGAKLNILGKDYEVSCVSMGNPHVITYVEDEKAIDIEKIGPAFENHPAFPERTNTEFIRVADRKNLYMRVWERGTGETLACGTGACASAVATMLNGLCDRAVTVHLLGGDLQIEWDASDNVVYMTGPAVTVFTGDYPLNM